MSTNRTDPGSRQGGGGIPDGFIVGLFTLLFGIAFLVWTATGLSGLFSHGGWPDGVTFARTPLALPSLLSSPTDLPAAWPDTPRDQFSGYGLFWGLVIGEALILVVLAVFVLGTLARWRAIRANRKTAGYEKAYAKPYEKPYEKPAPVPTEAVPTEAVPTEAAPAQRHPEPAPPRDTPPAPRTPADEQPPPPEPTPAPAATPAPPPTRIVYGSAAERREVALQAVRDAEGAALVVTSDPTLWAETKDARGKLGPVLVYDPGHLCETPARLRWNPAEGCEDPAVAQSRASALLAPVRPQARIDAAMTDTAETLLRCWLHAAAIDGRPFKQVHRWAQGSDAHEPVRILRTHPKAASGHAGLLESALTAHPERRRTAQELTARALTSLSLIHIRNACTANRADSVALAALLPEQGTLYVVGEPIEDPRTHPGAMPLLTALVTAVTDHARHQATRSPDARLDPPLSLVLDDIAAVAPLPGLPDLLTDGPSEGLPTLALMRSPAQAQARWPSPLPTP
ncbi:type VI secretion protein [Streptomyces laurentii]|uniref:type VI secretion protein n=1 Tax=Streptomyces laurentii TaxID=39478 RepID=UPI0033C42D34